MTHIEQDNASDLVATIWTCRLTRVADLLLCARVTVNIHRELSDEYAFLAEFAEFMRRKHLEVAA